MKEKFVKVPNKAIFLETVEVGSRIIRTRGDYVIADLCIHNFTDKYLVVSNWDEPDSKPVRYEWAKMFHFSHVLQSLNDHRVITSEHAISPMGYNWKAGDVFRVRSHGMTSFVEYTVREDSDPSVRVISVERKPDATYRHPSGGRYSKHVLFAGVHVNLVTTSEKKKTETPPKLKQGKAISAAKKKKEFILWCPTSNLPPRVIMRDGLEAAKGVAEDMARRHGTVFYVCELVAKAQVATVQQVSVADL